ncbi:MAG TPA: XrtA/PEP-CTERM system-associated ATPase [Vicinamibacterales bacterium]|nr:XrtA/PEP-CTERM system-associated ATPase [Vicinamibacterales bacterium]
MYERFYNLRERPFSLSPDPDYLYPSRVHKEALSYLRYGIEGHAGFIVITGEIGSGKTTMLQTALRGLDHRTSVSRIVNTMLDARELLEAVMLDFGLDPGADRSKPLLLRDLARFLVDQRSMGRLALLVIDEAQNLSLAALEEVRMLSNLETEKSKLIQIALIGQPNLRDLLQRPELEQLRQRVTVSYHLQPLDSVDTAAYVNHRLRKAAIGAPLEFSRDVTDLIHLHSEGIPRKINVIADAVLLFGYGEEQHAISVDLTQEAIEELEATGVIQPTDRTRAVRQPVPAPRLATASQEEEWRAREAQIAERERQIAEQQRVINEEYRLLKLRAERTVADPPLQGGDWAWPPAGPAPALRADGPAARAVVSPAPPPPAPVQAVAPAAPPPQRIVMPRREIPVAAGHADESTSLWSRVRRALFGDSLSVFED